MKQITQMTDIVEKVRHIALNADEFHNHIVNDTVNDYYNQVILQIITDMVVLPIERVLTNNEPIEDVTEVHDGMMQIIYTLSDLFQKNPKQVTKDMNSALQKYPLEDIRMSTFLKHKRRLN